MARLKRKRPAVEWLRWARKPFMLAFYSLGALLFFGLERLEAILGGKTVATVKPNPLSRKLTVTLSVEGENADIVMPFVPLFGGDSKWIKLKSEYVLKNLRYDGRAITLTGHLSSSSIPEGPYNVAAIAFLAAQRHVQSFLNDLSRAGAPLTINSVLATRRTGAVPHAKGLLLKIAVGSRKLELAPVKGGEGLAGSGAEIMAAFLPQGGEYHHLFIAADSSEIGKCLEVITAKGSGEMKLSVYACVNLGLDLMVPVFLLEPPPEKVRMEDAALLLMSPPPVEEPAPA